MDTLRKIVADVLVIGSGGAGIRAALEAAQSGLKVILIDKGVFGKSGSTSYGVAEVAGFNVADGAVDPNDTPEEHFKDIINAALGTCDPKLARIVAEESVFALKTLEDFGVIFEKDSQDKYLEIKGCFASRPRMHIIKGHGIPIINALSNRIKEVGVIVLDKTRVLELYIYDGVCRGAFCLNPEGDTLIIQAKSTILTTGGAGQIFKYTLNPSAITGDGYAVGWRAGAKLINMEFMQAGVGITSPFTSMLSAWLWEGKPRLYNEKGEGILPNYLPKGIDPSECIHEKSKHMPFSSRDTSRYVDIAIQSELTKREKESAFVYLDFTLSESLLGDLPKDSDFRKMWHVTKNWLIERGLDLTKTSFKIACFGHAINGGLVIDENAETTIPNLFAAGEVAGGPHGADRLGGNMLVTCQVFGRRAGRSAAQRAKEIKGFKDDRSERKMLESISIFSNPRKSTKINQKLLDLKNSIKDLLWRYFLILKTETSLNKCLEGLSSIQTEVQNETSLSDDFYDIKNMLDTAHIMVLAAKQRQESRGSHYRADYPVLDSKWRYSIQHWKEGNKENSSNIFFWGM